MFAEIFADYIISNGAPYILGESLFVDMYPNEPDSIMVITEYSSDPINRIMNELANRSFQLLFRDSNAEICYTNSRIVFDILNISTEKIVFSVDKNIWGTVHIQSVPFKLKVDENNRYYYAFNIYITTATLN